MRIKEVIIDGFKSYATRTVVSGFDAHFNAITGLNGSGKSNILDAICFTLGITNLNQVRVSNLQELVYKQGQAGVTKASVTIVFDNSDSKQSPVGYDQYDELTITRQVVIGGKNKYLINGHTAPYSQVQNLFHSVQLNVNNPHFLIMQGRITKVLNMKPIEILGMIEEAAGTRMYETKKQSALKTIVKKEDKVTEINRTMSDEISPTLETLRIQQSDYIKYQSNKTEIERLQRFMVAFKYVECKKKLEKSDAVLEEIQVSRSTEEKALLTLKDDIVAKKSLIKDLTLRKEASMEGEYSEIQTQEENLSKQLVKQNTLWQNSLASLTSKKKIHSDTMVSMKSAEGKENVLQKKIQSAKDKSDGYTTNLSEAQEKIQDLQQQRQAINAGITGDSEGSQSSLSDSLLELKGQLQEKQTLEKQQSMTAAHFKKQVKETEKLLVQSKKQGDKLRKEKEAAVKKLSSTENQLIALNYDEEVVSNLKVKVKKLENDLSDLTEREMELKASLKHVLDFKYSDPLPGFDRNRVKGFVASLIEVYDHRHATALEVTAGGKLYQVVVDSEETGKLLLKKGKLRRRVTIIPLNRIQSRPIQTATVKKAKHIGGEDKVHSAISLIGYPNDLDKAMKYVFGSSFVCEDLDTARKVTFHNDVKKKSVTLNGDSFDPSGTLSGGSRATGNSILVKLNKLSTLQKEIADVRNSLDSARQSLKKASQLENQYEEVSSKVELQKHELNIIVQRINDSEFSLLNEKFVEEKRVLDESNESITSAKLSKKKLQADIKSMESKIAAFESNRTERINKIEVEISSWKKKVSKVSSQCKSAEDTVETLQIEILTLVNDRDILSDQLTSLKQEVSQLEVTVEEQRVKVEEQKKSYSDVKRKLDSMKEAMVECDQEIKSAIASKDNMISQQQKVELEMKKIEGKLNRYSKEQSDAASLVKSLIKNYEWIEREESYFGQPHTDYDFSSKNPKHVERRVSGIEKEQIDLSKCINKKVIGMLEKAEHDYNELVNKRRIIENDKTQIENVIAELDEKKNEVLQTTWQKVNRDFGSIFSTLLPGTDAKLQPVEGKSVLDGLEVKVAFGGKYKESLTELSGGQRSLLALSLVLALLLFKPAPMYILDEVDAALDLSHTQNIGQIIKKHFSGSQFIVVSLKEGMFNNANVIFRTKFVDGISTVKRTYGSKTAAPIQDSNDLEEENDYAPKTKKRRGARKTSSSVRNRG